MLEVGRALVWHVSLVDMQHLQVKLLAPRVPLHNTPRRPLPVIHKPIVFVPLVIRAYPRVYHVQVCESTTRFSHQQQNHNHKPYVWLIA
jgi:hypothetical protein